MKILLLNTFYQHGGAARAASRLHRALTCMDVDAHLLVQESVGDCHRSIHAPKTPWQKASAFLTPALETLPLMAYPDRNRLPFFANLLPDRICAGVRDIDPDVINLHWVSAGFLRLETLKKLNRPLVWTLHDSWAFTGGCHLPLDCRRYTDACGRCPALGSRSELDLSRWTWNRKAKAWRDVPITLVTPSRWLARCARDSSLFRGSRIEVIPNGLDVNRFRPVEKGAARSLLGLPPDKKYILSGAVSMTSDSNKGFQHLAPALRKLKDAGFGTECEVLVFGAMEPVDAPDFGLKTHYLGYFHDEPRLSLLYSAADLFVAPSMQENLPYTVMEAMACGTPCVAFDVGGIPDLIDHKVTGYLASPFQAESLAEGMAWVLKGEVDQSAACRCKVESEFDISSTAGNYLELYSDLQAHS